MTGEPMTAPHPDALEQPETGPGLGPRDRTRALLLAGGAYLALSLFLWSNVWLSHPTSTTTCGCSDNSLFTWFIEWSAYAISHGLNPLYSTAMFHPTGENLLAQTGVVGIGLLLAPVTWLFGPIASLNVALTLAPVLSALAMFVLLRRWVTWTPAAFIGGLFYGFSPFIVVSLTDAQLNLGMAAVPPLVVLCLDELLFRQRRRPAVTGMLLGLLVLVQFFIGTEVLVIMAIGAVIGIALIVVYGARQPGALRRRARHATVGLAGGAITAVVLLAYPTWFALAGPAHLSGLLWPNDIAASAVANLKNFVVPVPSSLLFGYQGPSLSAQYFGIRVLAVLLGGIVIWLATVDCGCSVRSQ